jgi:signal transduction histidine kinase
MKGLGWSGVWRAWFLNRPLTSKLILIFSFPFLFLVAVTIITVHVFQEAESAEDLSERSHVIRSQATFFEQQLYSMQNAFRGFALTQDPTFLPQYYEAKGDIDIAGFELARLVEDSPSQVQRDRVTKIQESTRVLIAQKDEIISQVLSGAGDNGVAFIKSGRGQRLRGSIVALLQQFQKEAQFIQAARQAAVESKRALVLYLIVGGTVLTLLLTGLGVVMVARSVTQPMGALARAAVEIGEAGYASFPEADRQDEVGLLSRSMEEMQRRLVPAERLAAMTRMATSIAHDLRTPLVGIERGLQGLQYAADSSLSPDAQKLLGDLHAGARLAVGVVQDILDLYRQAYGEIPLSYSSFTLGAVIREAMDLMKSEIQDRRLSIFIEDRPVEILADQRRLFRVMVNLLENAIKNSPAGGAVRIGVSVQDEGPARRVVVAVEDEGRGLDPDVLDRLFEPNQPVPAPTRGGTGLGLYLCRLVIGAHQGTLTVQNRPAGGARFEFEIPVEVKHVDPTPDRG